MCEAVCVCVQARSPGDKYWVRVSVPAGATLVDLQTILIRALQPAEGAAGVRVRVRVHGTLCARVCNVAPL